MFFYEIPVSLGLKSTTSSPIVPDVVREGMPSVILVPETLQKSSPEVKHNRDLVSDANRLLVSLPASCAKGRGAGLRTPEVGLVRFRVSPDIASLGPGFVHPCMRRSDFDTTLPLSIVQQKFHVLAFGLNPVTKLSNLAWVVISGACCIIPRARLRPTTAKTKVAMVR